jgi:hypothetical protein
MEVIIVVRSRLGERFHVLGRTRDVHHVSMPRFLLKTGDHIVGERKSMRVHKEISVACLNAGLRAGVGLFAARYPLPEDYTGQFCAACCWEPAAASFNFESLGKNAADILEKAMTITTKKDHSPLPLCEPQKRIKREACEDSIPTPMVANVELPLVMSQRNSIGDTNSSQSNEFGGHRIRLRWRAGILSTKGRSSSHHHGYEVPSVQQKHEVLQTALARESNASSQSVIKPDVRVTVTAAGIDGRGLTWTSENMLSTFSAFKSNTKKEYRHGDSEPADRGQVQDIDASLQSASGDGIWVCQRLPTFEEQRRCVSGC